MEAKVGEKQQGLGKQGRREGKGKEEEVQAGEHSFFSIRFQPRISGRLGLADRGCWLGEKVGGHDYYGLIKGGKKKGGSNDK